MQLLKELEDLLMTHDWYYKYSDDMRYYCIGTQESKNIQAKLDSCKMAGVYIEAIKLYNKYSPLKKILPEDV